MPAFLKSFKEGLKYKWMDNGLFGLSALIILKRKKYRRALSHAFIDALKNFTIHLGKKKLQEFDKQSFVKDVLYLVEIVSLIKHLKFKAERMHIYDTEIL
jgi:hypothetical protein